jgi:uncharacterized protein
LGFELTEFKPRFAGGHRQTLYAWAKPRHFPRLPVPSVRYFDVAPEARVLAHCHWQERPWEHPTFLLSMGSKGPASPTIYLRHPSDKAWASGWNVMRLNQRNCGNTEHLSRGLYHSGLTHDPLFVMYHRASAMRVIERIRVPALIITADDDPFVPSEPFRHPRWPAIRT